jgi:hypothetical protein
MIPLRVPSTIARHDGTRAADLYSPTYFTERGDTSVNLSNFVDVDAPAIALDLSAVGNLSARLDIKRCLAENHCRPSVR